MRTAAIICECNPPHAGHARILAEAKQNSDCVVCLMSGPFVQRGEAAILTPHVRAGILLRMGADLVLELPFPYAASGAETFAAGAISILSRLGVTDLWFGSETADLPLLSRLASVAETPDFRARYASRLTADATAGTAALWSETLSEFCGLSAPLSPNDLLAVSYLRAVISQGSSLTPHAFPRSGSADSETALPPAGTIPSAAALRKAIFAGNLQGVYAFLPDYVSSVIASESTAGRFPITLDHAAPAILSHFRLCDPDAFREIADLSGGLGRRLWKAALSAADLPSLLSLAATKKYPLARLRRGILFSLLGVTRSDLSAPPAYVRLLSSNARGSAFLASIRRTSSIPVATSNAGVSALPLARRQDDLSRRALSLYALCFPSPVAPSDLLRASPLHAI